MGQMLEINLHSINNKVKFASSSRDNDEISVDYFPPVGDGEGYTSLELLLISAASCVSTLALTILRQKMRRNVISLHANAKGAMRDAHPKKLETIWLEIVIQSPDAEEADLAALAEAEDKLCPVLAMLKGNVVINITHKIER